MTNRNILPELSGLVGSNGRLRKLAFAKFRKNTFEAQLSSTELQASFQAELDLLRHFRSPEDPWGDPWPFVDKEFPRPGTIVLRFETSDVASLEELRIDATALVEATKYWPIHTRIRIELHLLDRAGPGGKKEQYNTKVRDLHDTIMVALDRMYKHNSNHTELQHPAIWIDGNGALRRIDCLAKGSKEKTTIWRGDDVTYTPTVLRDMADAMTGHSLEDEPGPEWESWDSTSELGSDWEPDFDSDLDAASESESDSKHGSTGRV